MSEEREEKVEQSLRDLYKVPLSCPACNVVLDHWRAKPFYRLGVCSECDINYIEGRSLPPELLKDREKLREYLKEKISEKEE